MQERREQAEAAVLPVIARLYRASVDPPQWNLFAAELSDTLGGAAVTLAIRRPESRLGWDYYGAGSHDLAMLVAEDLQGALIRAARRVSGFRQHFVDLAEAFPDIALEEDPWFREWLDPRGVTPVWPYCHAVTVDHAVLCWIIVHPSAASDFDPELMSSIGDRLVPHLSRALTIHHDTSIRLHKQHAMEEILDRMPVGVVLVDTNRRVTHANLSAQRMLALEDGLFVWDARLRADEEQDEELQQVLDAVVQAAASGDVDHVSRIAVGTRSGRRPFMLAVTPVMRGVSPGQVHDAAAVVFFSNPDALTSTSIQALEAIYGLTDAEAAIVQGLIEGRSVEDIAADRDVKPDTARTQLKQVFAKTRTNRQAELIRLVISGVSPLSQSLSLSPGGSGEGAS